MSDLSSADFSKLVAQTPQGAVQWTDRPPDPGPDTLPAATGVRFKHQPGANMEGLDPALVSAVNRLYDVAPTSLRDAGTITEHGARRTFEQQAQYHAAYLAGTGPVAAAPEVGRHVRGGAFDFSRQGDGQRWIEWMNSAEGAKVLASVGLETGKRFNDPVHVQLIENGSAERGTTVTERRSADNKALSADDFAKLVANAPKAGMSDSRVAPLSDQVPYVDPQGSVIFTDPAMQAQYNEQNSAVISGVLRGALDVPLGVAQATLPREVMAPVEQKLRDLTSQFSELEDKHPTESYAGRLVGSTLALVASSRLIGATGVAALMPRAATTAWDAIGLLGRGAATGAAAGATQFYPEGPEKEDRAFGLPTRLVDSAIGSVWGGIVGAIGRGVQFAANKLSMETATQRVRDAAAGLYAQGEKLSGQFMMTLQETARNLTRNSVAPLQDALGRYRRVEQTAATLYGLRNEAGRNFEGFPAGVGADVEGLAVEDGFKQAINAVLAQSQKSGVETRRQTQSAVARVRQELGLDREEGRLGEWRAQVAQYDKALTDWTAARDRVVGKMPDGTLPSDAEATVARLTASGQMAPRPEVPAPYRPEPVTADRYAQARTALNLSIRSTRDAAARTQMKMLLGAIDAVAKDAAAEFDISGEEFVRRATAANDFYMKNVAPLRQFFGGKTSTEVAGRPGVPLDGMTPAAFYDKVAKVIESNDTAAIDGLAKALGPRGRDNMKMIVAAQATLNGDAKALQYVKRHEDALRKLLGQDEFKQLKGLAAISEHLAEMKPATQTATGKRDRRLLIRLSEGFGPALGFYQLGHALVNQLWGSGTTVNEHLAQAAVMFGAVPMTHLAYNVIDKVHRIPVVRPLIRRAGTLLPGSAEMDALITTIDRRTRLTAAAGARTTAP